MPTIKPTQLSTQRNASFTIGNPADNHAAVCSSIRAEPTGSGVSFTGMTPDAVWEENGDWQIVLTFADDYDGASSLWNYLYDHEGESLPIEFYPNINGQGFAATASVKAGGIGGGARAVATSTVTLRLGGKPTKIAMPAPSVASISGVSPTPAPLTATQVVIRGAGFPTGTPAVTFGGVAATAVTRLDANTITATMPVQASAGETVVKVTATGTPFVLRRQ